MKDATQTLESICVLDCPDACTLEVEVADGRVVSIDGEALTFGLTLA